LAGNIIRFAIGPYLLKPDEDDHKTRPPLRDAERQPLLGGIQPGEPIPNLHPRYINEDETKAEKTKRLLSKIREFCELHVTRALLVSTST
jgi:hypothetical protein